MTTELYQTPALEASRRPIVTARDGDVFANSRDVAAYFAKEHRDVLRSIDALVAQEPGLALRNFAQGSYTLAATGDQQHRCFDMNRDGFTLLAMGFTGGKALRWKLAYIEAFNSMEAELRTSPSIVLDYSDPKVLLGVLDHLQTKVSEQQAVIEEQGEKVKQLARLEGARGSMCLSDAAKTLGWKRADFIARLAAERWIFKRAGSKNWLAYDSKRHAGLMEHDDHLYMDGEGRERVATRALVTAKGLVKLAEILGAPLH